MAHRPEPPGARIVRHARGWIGTPYRHQASLKGAGCDCLGLVRGIWREIVGAEPETVPPYTQDWAEPQREEALLAAALRHLTPVMAAGPPGPGEVLLFRMREGAVAKHLGIATDAGFVHAYERCGVTESRLSRPWARRIAARFTYPERS